MRIILYLFSVLFLILAINTLLKIMNLEKINTFTINNNICLNNKDEQKNLDALEKLNIKIWIICDKNINKLNYLKDYLISNCTSINCVVNGKYEHYDVILVNLNESGIVKAIILDKKTNKIKTIFTAKNLLEALQKLERMKVAEILKNINK